MKLKSTFTVIFLIFLSVFMFSQNQFPYSWIGEWEGKMYLYRGTTISDTVDVYFKIAETSEKNTWTWKTVYFDKDTIVKDYRLKLIDLNSNHYVIDEGDSIVLNAYFIDNKLISMFSVEKMPLPCYYELKGKILTFDISIWQKSADLPENIEDYKILTYQKTILKRKK